MVTSCTPATGDLAHNPGMCPDWELNWRPFGLQACTQSTEPHQPGLIYLFFRERGRERGRETLMCQRYIDWLPFACLQLGAWPTTQTCGLTRNRIRDLLVCRLTLSPPSHTSQGIAYTFLIRILTLMSLCFYV